MKLTATVADLQLDPLCPPKYCPQCAMSGIKTKVKKFKLADKNLVIMCKNEKCPWPFSVRSPSEVTVKADVQISSTPSAGDGLGKKRKARPNKKARPNEISEEISNERRDITMAGDLSISNDEPATSEDAKDFGNIFIEDRTKHSVIVTETNFSYDLDMLDSEPEEVREDLEEVLFASDKTVILNIFEEENIAHAQPNFEPLNQNFLQDLQTPQSIRPKTPLYNQSDFVQSTTQDMSEYDTILPDIPRSLVSPHKQMSPDQSHNSLVSSSIISDGHSPEDLPSPSASIQQEDVSSPTFHLSAFSSAPQSDPHDLMFTSLYTNQTCSVIHLTQCDPTINAPQDAVGQGPKLLKFFYINPIENTRMGFSPVRVTTEEQANYVVALVAEWAEEYYRRNSTEVMKPMVYTTEAAMATYVLAKIIVIHIKRCFSKKGMAVPTFGVGRKRRKSKAGKSLNDESSNVKENGCLTKKIIAGSKIGIKKRILKTKNSLDESASVGEKVCLTKKGKAGSKPVRKERNSKIKEQLNSVNQDILVSEKSCNKSGNFSKNLNDLSKKLKTEYKQLKKGLYIVKAVPKEIKATKRGKGRPKQVQRIEANGLASQATASRILDQLSNQQLHRKQKMLSTDFKSSPGKHAKTYTLKLLPHELKCLSPPITEFSDQLSLTESLYSQLPVVSCSQEIADQMAANSGILTLPCPLSVYSDHPTDVSSFIKNTSTLFDIDEDGELVQAEMVGHHEPEVSNKSETETKFHHIGTFERSGNQSHTASSSFLSSLSSKLCLKAGMTIEAEKLPPESSTRLSFTTRSPDAEDDIATVMKLGTGVSVDKVLGQIVDSEGPNMNEKENSVVFHVANQTMTTQPSVMENFKVKDQGNTRVLLTSSSDLVQLEDLKKGSVQFNFRPDSDQTGRGKQISSSKGMFGERGLPPKLNSISSFYWKDWLVDSKLILEFSDYLQKLERKFNLPKKSKIDTRIQALLKEKESNTVKPETMQKVISFFAEVYVKYLYLTASFLTLDLKKMLSILKNHHILDNQQFAAHICLLMSRQKQDSTNIGNRDQYNELVSSELDTRDKLTNNLGSSNISSNNSDLDKSEIQLIVSPSEDGSNNILISSSPDPSCPKLTFSHQYEPDNDLMSRSLYTDQTCSVKITHADPTATTKDVVGHGTKQLQFFYINLGEETRMVFPPVRVSTEEEVNCVVALVTENAEEFNRRNTKKRFRKPIEAALATSVLDKKIVSHIKRCFTKRGMTELKLGRRKWSGLKRKDVIKIPSEKAAAVVKVDFVSDDEETEELQEIEELKEYQKAEEMGKEVVEALFEEPLEEEWLEEYVPTEEELKLEMEEKLFGGSLPKIVRRERPPRTGASDREGRGGRNEFAKKNVPDSLKLGAVEYMLACKKIKDGGDQVPLPRPTICLAGLFRKRRTRRRKINIDFDDLSDDEDEDFKVPSIYNRKADRPDGKNKRKSSRLTERQVRVESGEYFDVDNYQFMENQQSSTIITEGEYWQDARQDSEHSQSASSKGTSGANVNENYLRRSMTNLGQFDQAFARKKHSKKVLKLLGKKLRADTAVNKKYKGFGENVDKELVARQTMKHERRGLGRHINKKQVSEGEHKLMRELLANEQAAVAESEASSASVSPQFSNMIDTTVTQGFDEAQSISPDPDSQDSDNFYLY